MAIFSRPYVEIFSEIVAEDKVIFHAVGAILLASCPTIRLRALTLYGKSENSIEKQIDLINSLYQPAAPVLYAIRYISRPNRASLNAGRIDVAIFCRWSSYSEEEARRQVEDQLSQLLVQLCASFPDYIWQVVTTQEDFVRIWKPIEWDKARVAEIQRREELVTLDSIKPTRRLGFDNTLVDDEEIPRTNLYVVHPFLPHPGQLERLLRMILLNPHKIVFTVMLSPVDLEDSEEQLLMDEISSSEGFRKNPSPNIQRIQEHRAAMVCNALMSQMLSLQDAPFYTTITLASPEKLPATLVEAAGLAVSASIGEVPNSAYTEPAFIQMGGYDVAFPVSKEDKNIVRANLATLSQQSWGKSLAPVGMQRLRYMMNGHESACAFRFPEDVGDGLPGMKTHTERSRPIPLELTQKVDRLDPAQTLLLGTNTHMGLTSDVRLPLNDRLLHMYVVGQTGTGKSTLLKTMLISDMEAGRGCALIDPHGDLYEEMLGLIPPERVKDVILLDPSDMKFPFGMNLLEANTWEEQHFVVREMQAIMRRLLAEDYGRFGAEFAGPVFYQHMQMNMLLVMSDPEHPGTLLDFYEVYQSSDYWKRWIPLKTEDPQLKMWVENTLSHMDYTRRYESGHSTWGEYLSSKFMDFIFDPRLRLIFGQPESTFNLQEIMNDGKILLVNLAKGLLGEANSRFLGLILMAKIQAEAMKRAKLQPAKRRPFFLYVDEFQSLATENFTILLSEARKFKLGLVLANQFLSQITDQRIIQAVFGNVGSFLSFRLGREDAVLVEPQFLPYFDQMDLINMPNWQVAMRTTVDGASLRPFSLNTILSNRDYDAKIANQVRTRSRVVHGKTREQVEKVISENLANKPPL